MFKRAGLFFLTAGLATAASVAVGEEQTTRPVPAQQAVRGSFFGPQLLSEDEQAAYRARIRSAKTAQETESIRAEHYELMKVRAREQGFALPDQRPPVGGSIGNIFGPQLMTEEERAAYRAKIRSANTQEAFEKIRTERNVDIETRAKESGVALPAAQPAMAGGNGGSIVGSFFGPTLMTEEEQAAYRARLRGAKTQDEQDRIRAEHRQQLQARAEEKGVALPK